MKLAYSLVASLLGLMISARAGETVDYLNQINPILQQHCFCCHGGLQQNARLRLNTGALAREGENHGPALEPGYPAKGPLFQRITAAKSDERMPQEGAPLSEAQIELLKRWIEQGALSPEDELPDANPSEQWAFRTAHPMALPLG